MAVPTSQPETEGLISLFLRERYEAELRSILTEKDLEAHYGLEVNYQVLLDFDSEITHDLVSSPLQMLPLLDSCLVNTVKSLHKPEEGLVAKPHCHMRFSQLLPFEELMMNVVPRLEHVGRFVSFSGTVVRTGAVKVLECQREFMCNKCRERFTVRADYEQFHTINQPSCCPTNICNSLKFSQVEGEEGSHIYQDYQEIKLQEQTQHLEVGTIPHCLWVVLENDLVDCCKPGDDVTITGVVIRRWKPLSVGCPCDLELVLMANHVMVNNNQRACVVVTEKMVAKFEEFWSAYKHKPLEGRNVILANFCPQIFGLYVVKLSICLALIGGVQCTDSSGTKVRGESHLLLVGDPGTGKSQFLKYAAKLVPRSVLTTGVGTTSAGLTVCAVKDVGEWQLEAGALVLSDGGLCCIDEFSGLREQDRASIHEAMEQQTISVAKAGLVCKLNTRCTILAATNPKGSYDLDQPLSVNTALASPLLSRFDVVLILVDAYNETWDRVVSEHILNPKQQDITVSESPGSKAESTLEGMWGLGTMQAYFAHVKTVSPTMTVEANQILAKYYTLQRLDTHHNEARTTVRLLESLLRLAQAHAKLMCRAEVSLQDAVVAITVVECSMQGSSLLGGINVLHSAFPGDGDEEYKVQEQLVLEKLGLSHLSRDEVQLTQPPAPPSTQPPAPPSNQPPAPPSDPSVVSSQQWQPHRASIAPVVQTSPNTSTPSALSSLHEDCDQSPSHPHLEPSQSSSHTTNTAKSSSHITNTAQSSSHVANISQSSSHTANTSLSTALSQLRNKRPNSGGEGTGPKRMALSPSNAK